MSRVKAASSSAEGLSDLVSGSGDPGLYLLVECSDDCEGQALALRQRNGKSLVSCDAEGCHGLDSSQGEPLPRKPERVNQLMKGYGHNVIFPGGGVLVMAEIREIGSVAERCINIECPWT